MSKIVLDAELRAKLNGATEVTEITDESGRVIGRFVPEGRSYATDAVFDRVASALLPPLSDVERAAARAEVIEHGGVSGEELRAQLAEIERQWKGRQ